MANRDLKLENLLLDRDGSDGTRPLLKICDFGYSKVHSLTLAYLAHSAAVGWSRVPPRRCSMCVAGSRSPQQGDAWRHHVNHEHLHAHMNEAYWHVRGPQQLHSGCQHMQRSFLEQFPCLSAGSWYDSTRSREMYGSVVLNSASWQYTLRGPRFDPRGPRTCVSHTSAAAALTCADCAECSTSRTRRPRRGLEPPSTWRLRSYMAATAMTQRCGCPAKSAHAAVERAGPGKMSGDLLRAASAGRCPRTCMRAADRLQHWRHEPLLHASPAARQ